MLNYRGYTGHVELDDEAELFHGEVLGIRDVVTFQGRSVAEIETAFQASVDDYLDYCEKRGEAPDVAITEHVTLTLPKELHRQVLVGARRAGKSVNDFVVERLQGI